MPRTGTPTDNAIIEAINGWSKEALFLDFGLATARKVPKLLKQYVHYYNNGQPAAALGNRSPVQYKTGQVSWTRLCFPSFQIASQKTSYRIFAFTICGILREVYCWKTVLISRPFRNSWVTAKRLLRLIFFCIVLSVVDTLLQTL